MLALVAAEARGALPGPAPTPAPPPPEWPALAEQGKFAAVLAALQADDAAAADSPLLASLRSALQRYEEHRADAEAHRAKAQAAALERMGKADAAGRVDQALVGLVEARLLSDRPAEILARPDVTEVVRKAEAQAAAAEGIHDSLEALSVYRQLEAVFEDQSRYREHIKRGERQVRLVRLYAPEVFRQQFTARFKAITAPVDDAPGNPTTAPAEPQFFGNETWEQQLEGVELAVLEQSLDQAARRHVAGGGYRPLLLGAIDGLAAVTDCPPLREVFKGLGDAAQRDRFRQVLQETRRDVQQARKLDAYDLNRTLAKLVKASQDTVALPDQVVVYEMADGAMGNLDEFTGIIWPREKEDLQRTTQGKFYGIGILISRRNERLVVISPLTGTPAYNAGIRPGDVIATVDGQSTAGWSLDQAVRCITGPEGTEVVLGVERAGSVEPIRFALRRAEIIIESVKGWQHTPEGGWDFMVDPAARIGYVRLTQFIPQSADDLDAAVNQMEKSGPLNGLVLDLRLNPGGLLPAAVEIANRFVGRGVIVSTVSGDGRVKDEYRARRDRAYADFPVAVLVNEGSASASEIVSGCLQDYQRATVVGMRTFGKGSVQDLYDLQNGKAYLKLTTHYYRLSGGRIIHRQPDAKTWGVEPDVRVMLTGQQAADAAEYRQELDVIHRPDEPPTTRPARQAADLVDKGIDPQLEAALLVLKTRLAVQKLAIAGKAAPTNAP